MKINKKAKCMLQLQLKKYIQYIAGDELKSNVIKCLVHFIPYNIASCVVLCYIILNYIYRIKW